MAAFILTFLVLAILIIMAFRVMADMAAAIMIMDIGVTAAIMPTLAMADTTAFLADTTEAAMDTLADSMEVMVILADMAEVMEVMATTKKNGCTHGM
jgi:hypothetical protein